MTNKPLPSGPSAYVAELLLPLQCIAASATLSQDNDQQQQGQQPCLLLRPADRAALACATLNRVASSFVDCARELVDVVEKTDTSLRRLHKSSAEPLDPSALSGPLSRPLTDSEKIRLQLLIDVRQFCADARGAAQAAEQGGEQAAAQVRLLEEALRQLEASAGIKKARLA
jgi:hypothetical protein